MTIYEERHVLFCDILGFTRAVVDGNMDPTKLFLAFNHLQATVNELNKAISPEATDPESGHVYDYIVTPRAEHFSDCIAISTPATNVDAIWLCQAAAEMQNLLVRRGFLSRGAILLVLYTILKQAFLVQHSLKRSIVKKKLVTQELKSVLKLYFTFAKQIL